jgi:dolichyl-phosphate beta-glucosyltransferase
VGNLILVLAASTPRARQCFSPSRIYAIGQAMPSLPHLSVIIPAYNEAHRLPPTLEAVITYLERQPYTTEVLVVDDGCTDETPRLVTARAAASALPLQLVPHTERRHRGKGAAVQRGMAVARGAFRLFMDADNAIAIEHVERCWPRFDDGNAVVIGVRGPDDGAALSPWHVWYRRAVSCAGNLVIRTLAVPGMRDTQTGFKMFTGSCAAVIFPQLTITGWGFDIEVLALARRLGYRIAEVPVHVHNQPDSKVKLLAYFEVLRDVWRVQRRLRTVRGA